MNEEAILQELGRRIRERRRKIGSTQEQLALKAGVDRSYYGAIERGERNITFTVLCRLCIALRCDLASLTERLPERVGSDSAV